VLGRRLFLPAPFLLGAPLLGPGVLHRALAAMASPAEALPVKPPATQVAFCVSSIGFRYLPAVDAQLLFAKDVENLLAILKAEDLLKNTTAYTVNDLQLYVLRSVAGDEPTPAEERDVVLLPPDTLLRDFVDDPVNRISPNNVGKVFVLVGPEGIHQRAFVIFHLLVFI
jgi:hypothetical protein